MSSTKDKQLQRGILGYILSLRDRNEDENLGVAYDCLKTAFALEDVEASDELLQRFTGGGGGDVVDDKLQAWLDKIASKGYFDGCEKGSDEYKLRYQKAVDKFNAKIGKTAAKAAPAPAPAPAAPADTRTEEEKIAEGDAFKAKGNEAFKAGRNEEAVELYEQAIKACPNGPSTHIFHCNKAAALQKTKQFEQAVDECEKAIKLNAKYTKAYSRRGAAQYELRQYDLAADSYRHVLDLEPTNESAITQLKLCEGKSSATTSSTTSSAGTGSPAGGMPDLSALAGMMGGGGGGAGGGGGLDFASMMQSPMFQQMSQQLMQNPQAMQMAQNMMKDPQMMQNMMGMMGGAGRGGGGGGMPDLSALAGMMGGSGAGGGSTPGDDSGPQYKDTD